MTDEAMRDTVLEGRVRAAYDAMGPSDEARERVLQALTGEGEATSRTPAARSRRPLVLVVALAAAACVALAVVLVRAPSPVASDSMAANATKADEAPAAGVAPAADEAEEYAAQDVAAMGADEREAAVQDSVAKQTAPAMPACPLVTLADGARRQVVGPATDDVDESEVEAAVASSADGARSVACEVAEGRFVRYEDDPVWYDTAPAAQD